MKRISEHIRIYLLQKESLFSILGRVSVNTTVVLFPLVYLVDDYLVYFLYMWLSILILFYHTVYSIGKLLISDIGISIIFTIVPGIITFWEGFLSDEPFLYFSYFLAFHIGIGLYNLLEDYLLSDLEELFFFDDYRLKLFLIYYFPTYFTWFITFYYW